MPHFARPATLAALALVLTATAAHAVITKLTPLAEVLESDQFIFVAKVDKLDPDNKDRPTATFTVGKKLKGEPPFDRIPVNMTGDDEAKKAGDTKTIFERLDGTRELVFFVRKQGKIYNAKVFVEGSWFSIYGTLDADGKTVRWALLHGEPFLRRTFKGTSAEMVKTIEDALAKRGKPPEPDEKEKPGYGPPAAKEGGGRKEEGGMKEDKPSSLFASSDSALRPPPSALLGVIPSFVLVGPLAIVAALFPGVFARMAVGMKRWRAFLTVASINSTLALIYFAVSTYRAHWLPPGVAALGPRPVTLYLTLISVIGLVWSGRRYRTMAGAEPDVTRTPVRAELLALAGLTLFAAVCTVLTAAFADWNSTLTMPMREFTFIGIALLVATVYAGYRALTRRADGENPAVRLSLSGESVGLGTLALCGFAAVLLMGARDAGPVATGTTAGDAEGAVGPRLVGEPVVFEVREGDPGKEEKVFGRVMSNLTLDGDRLYFGAETQTGQSGRVLGINRHTGKLEWAYDEPGMLSVFCTPAVANGKVYCGEGMHTNKGCRLFCANASDGNPAWEKPFKTKEGHTEGQPVIANGKVYFPAGDDGLICADANTGAQLWQYTGKAKDDVHIDAPPALSSDGRTVFAGSGLFNYVAVAVDANTGEEKWRTDLKLRVFGAPLVSGGKVFYGVGTGNMGADTFKYDEEGGEREQKAAGAVCCLDAATGKEEWRYELPKSVHTGLAADAFTVYTGCRDGYVYAFDRKTGKLRWQAGLGVSVLSAPAVATSGGYPVAVYAVSGEGRVYCLNPQTGATVWSRDGLPGHEWRGLDQNNLMCAPVVVTTATATGSKRAIYIGGMLTDPNPNIRHVAVWKFEDVIGE